jgi:hypothetical protein
MPRSRYSRFRDGVQISGVSMAVPQTGKVFYVCNSTTLTEFGIAGSDGNNGRTPEQPLATIDYAIGLCAANRGDTIFVMQGHAETLATASAIALDVAGVSIIGMGEGSSRPVLTFSATAATIAISAASCTFSNIIVTPSIDSVVTAFVVSAADVDLDIESRDASSAIEFVGVVTTTAAADRFKLKLKHRGFTDGNAGVRTVALVGCDGGDIDIDFYGAASTAVVGMLTTASTNINIKMPSVHNGATVLTKDVVDTQGSSTWNVHGFDEVGGFDFVGSSAIGLQIAMPSGEMAIQGIAKTLPATTTQTLFTITGGPVEILDLFGEVTTLVQTQACNFKYSIIDTATTTSTDISADLNITAAAVGAFLTLNTTLAGATIKSLGGTSIKNNAQIRAPIGTVICTTNATNTGAVRYQMRYRPLAPGAKVVAN